MFDVSRLFNHPTRTGDYIGNLAVPDQVSDALKDAKDKIIDHLSSVLPSYTLDKFGEAVRPRFLTQGSQKYGTCNGPCWDPPQEVDYDLGVYFPVTLWTDNDTGPKRAAIEYFAAMEHLLAPLLVENSWSFPAEQPKKCVRISISGHSAHIDLPLYAAPEKEFQTIVEKSMAQFADARLKRLAEAALSEKEWMALSKIALAQRDGKWLASDPRQINKWFAEEKAIRDDADSKQLVRICRFLKGWRDHNWRNGDGPSSILLMVIVCQDLDHKLGRDDLALLELTKSLPERLLGSVLEPRIGKEEFNRMSVSDREVASDMAKALYRALHSAIRDRKPGEQEAAVLDLKEVFGDRIPAQPEWVVLAASREAVRATSATVVAQPVVRPTHAA